MGGEAIKSLQIYLELDRNGMHVQQITHAQAPPEIDRRYPDMQVTYIEDDFWQKLCWNSIVLRPLVNLLFFRHAAKVAQRLIENYPNAVVHYKCACIARNPALSRCRMRRWSSGL